MIKSYWIELWLLMKLGCQCTVRPIEFYTPQIKTHPFRKFRNYTPTRVPKVLKFFFTMSLKTKSAREIKRIQIQALFKEGISPTEISRKVGVARNTVYLWKNRKSFIDKPRPGKKTKIDTFTKSTIRRKLYRRTDSSVRKTAATLNQSKNYLDQGKKISKSTVQNYLKRTKWGKSPFKTPFKSKLSQKNIEDRVKFAEIVEKSRHLTDGPRGRELRSHTLFTDETTIELYPKSKANEGRFRTENRKDVPPKEVPKFSDKIMIAGGFCSRGVTDLHFFEKGIRVDAKYFSEKVLPIYIRAMNDPRLFPIKSKITYQQDGAGCHNGKNLVTLRAHNYNLWIKGVYPGNSPDLNPIENLWPRLKDAVQKSPKPRNLPELKRRITKAWNELPLDLLEKLAQPFKDRVEEMAKLDGRHTKY